MIHDRSVAFPRRPMPVVLILALAFVAVADASEATGELAELRERLHERLAARMAADAEVEAPVDLVLSLEAAIRHHGGKVRVGADHSGVVHEWANFHLHRRGGKWMRPTIAELSPGLTRRLVVHAIDCGDLAWADGGLRGVVDFTSSRYRHREDMHGAVVFHHLPPEAMPVPNWRLGGHYRTRPFTQRYTVDLPADAPRGWTLRLEFPGGLRTGDRGRDIELFARIDANGYLIEGWARTPGWNLAAHAVFVDELEVDEEGISGTLKIRTHRDRWVGRVAVQRFRFEAEPDRHGHLAADYEAAGPFGQYRGRLRGTCRTTLLGSYRGEGPDGASAGRAFLELAPAPVAPVALADPGDADPAAVGLARHRQVRALDRALRRYPEPLATALDATTAVGAAPGDHHAGLAWLARTAAVGLEAPAPAEGAATPDDPRFGPFAGDAAALESVDGVSRLPAVSAQGPQRWTFVPAWRWCGPVFGAPGPAGLAELPPHDGWRPADGKQVRAWTAARTEAPRLLPDPVRTAVREAGEESFHYYLTARIESPAAQRVWMALPAHRMGALWCNGRPVWRGAEDADALQTAVFAVDLEEGANELLLRSGMGGLNWSKGMGSVTKNAQVRIEAAAAGLWIAVAGSPAAHDAAPPPVDLDAETPPASDGEPPLAWNIAAGRNLRWSVDLPPGGRRIVRLGDHLVAVGGGAVQAFALEDGRRAWRTSIAGAAASHPVAADKRCWIWSSDGVVLCVDAAGELAWSAKTDFTWDPQEGRVPTPVRADDRVFLRRRDDERISVDDGKTRVVPHVATLCLDAATGEERWRSRHRGTGVGLAPMPLARGDVRTLVLITADGDCIDGRDGRLVHRELTGAAHDPVLPEVVGDTCYWVGDSGDNWMGGWQSGWKAAVRLWLDDAQRICARFVWRSKGPSHYAGPPPLKHGPFLYTNRTNSGHHQEGPAPYSKLHVYDAATGTLLGDTNPLLDYGTSPKSIDVAGGKLYCGDVGGRQYFNPREEARIAVCSLGERPVVMAENFVPVSPHPPIFVGDQLYVSGEGRLHCLAVDDEEGRRWQYEQLARYLMLRLRSKPTDPTEKGLRPESLAAEPDREVVPVAPFRHRTLPSEMLILGPFPLELPEEVWHDRLALDDPQGPSPVRGRSYDWPGGPYEWRPAADGQIIYAGPNWMPFGNRYMYGDKWLLSLWPTVAGKTGYAAILGCVLRVDRPGTYKLDSAGHANRVWFAGRELADGQVLDLRPGDYNFFVRIGIGDVPEFLRERRLVAKIRFYHWLDVEEKVARWKAALRANRAILEEVATAIPESTWGDQIRNMVELLDEE